MKHWILWIALVLFTGWIVTLSGWLTFCYLWQHDRTAWWAYPLFLACVGLMFLVFWFCPFGI